MIYTLRVLGIASLIGMAILFLSFIYFVNPKIPLILLIGILFVLAFLFLRGGFHLPSNGGRALSFIGASYGLISCAFLGGLLFHDFSLLFFPLALLFLMLGITKLIFGFLVKDLLTEWVWIWASSFTSLIISLLFFAWWLSQKELNQMGTSSSQLNFFVAMTIVSLVGIELLINGMAFWIMAWKHGNEV